MTRVRFHLGSGEHFKHWQVKTGRKVEFFDPDKFSIIMDICSLHNHRRIAEEIFYGANKDVCAWIRCKWIKVVPRDEAPEPAWPIYYDPKVAPFWRNAEHFDIDGHRYAALVTRGKRVFTRMLL